MPDRSDRSASSSRSRASKDAPTIYDVAALAGVNPSTVSRALTTPGRISGKTERRVRDAAEKLNYQANPMARALHTGRSRMIGLVIADFTNPVFFEVVRGAEKSAADQDYVVVLVESRESAENELRAVRRLLPVVDGIVLSTSRLADERIRELSAVKPLVLVNRVVDGIPAFYADIDRGIAEAVEHLRDLGHRAIVYVAGPADSWMSQRRATSLAAHCAQAGMGFSVLPSSAPTLDGGRAIAGAIRTGGGTAVVAYNDLMAIGLMEELIASGAGVPGTVSVVGFDDIFGSDLTTPRLTTISSPLHDVSALAVGGLIGLLDKAEPAAPSAELVTRLVVRESTGRGDLATD
jgi:LacI family transcriptional regulator